MNRAILKLERHDLNLGWHAFLWYQKAKDNKKCKNHLKRKALNWIWTKIWEENYQKVPEWVSPVEAFTPPTLMEKKKLLRYRDLLKEDLSMKSRKELEEQGIILDWWTKTQIDRLGTSSLLFLCPGWIK